MSALVEVDVTEAWERAQQQDISPTAIVVACVGRAVATHPQLHAYRDFLGRLVTHRHVDVATMLDVGTPTGRFPLAHPLHNADTRSVKDLSDELRGVAESPDIGWAGRWLMRWAGIAGRIPGLVRVIYFISARSRWLRGKGGTVAVSAVGMMLGGNGFGIAIPTMTLVIVIGGVSEKPWIVNGNIQARRIMDLTIQIDHRIVDGAPAARFGATLRQLLEHPHLIEW